MPKGVKGRIGDRTVNKNGYEYELTEEGWRGTHILLMEDHLGRRLVPGEYVAFKNGHIPPITLEMIDLRRHGDKRSRKARMAEILGRIEQLKAEYDILEAEENGTAEANQG